MTAVVILGMHRSGTSLVANILQEMGVEMGADLLDADKYNIGGYWEDEDFLWINKGILENAGGSWLNPPDRDAIIQSSEKFSTTIEKTITKKEHLSNGFWGWKDPRTSLTSCVFDPYLDNAKYIVVKRNIDDTIRSLRRTHGIKVNWDELYQIYRQRIRLFVEDKVVLTVSYEDLVSAEISKAILYWMNKFIEIDLVETEILEVRRLIRHV